MEVIWTASAAEDYLRAETNRPDEFIAGIDGALRLLKVFPKLGATVPHSKKLRRILVGRNRHLGLYYGLTPARITVVALIDLRQDPASIEAMIRDREP
jgi:plasmid stabilization system protein ParE